MAEANFVDDVLSAMTQPDLVLQVGADLDVRSFDVREGISRLFSVDLVCRSPDAAIDPDALIGRAVTFSVRRGLAGHQRLWAGVVSHFAAVEAEEAGLSTYDMTIVPELWLASQMRTYRIYQQQSDVDIALDILSRWGIEPEVRLRDTYKKRRYRTQYGESDFAFFCRMLEDAGVAFFFDTTAEGGSRLVLDDTPQAAESRTPLPYVSEGMDKQRNDFATRVVISRAVRPGKYTLQDLDYRMPPSMPLTGASAGGLSVERDLERHHYVPGSMLYDGAGGDTPSADDRGAQRTDLGAGAEQAKKRLEAKRGSGRRIRFATSAVDVRPGQVLSISDHPKRELAGAPPLLVVWSRFSGSAVGSDWAHVAEAQPASDTFRPPVVTPKPRTAGVEAATVVGPPGEEIHTDEFGRVRVHFHWDREGSADESSSLWVPVSQPWGGTSFGALNIPRIGQEVIVDFLDGDPDRPLVMGRVFTKTNPTPYKLPEFQNLQGIRSESSPRLPAGSARSGILGGKLAGGGDGAGEAGHHSSPLGGGMPLSLDQITKLLTSSKFFQALSPNGQTHNWQGSELVMHDEQGNEKMYMQAQKDLHEVIKNNQTQVIGHAKAEIAGTDHIQHIGNKEAFRVTSDRTGMVGGSQGVMVKDAVYRESQANQVFLTKTTYDSSAKNIAFKSDEGFSSDAKTHQLKSTIETIISVGSSSIIIRPEGISINADILLIKPDNLDISYALTSGSLEEALAKTKKKAETNMAREELRNYRDHQLPSSYEAKKNFLKSQLQDFTSLSDADKDMIAIGDLDRRGIQPPYGRMAR